MRKRDYYEGSDDLRPIIDEPGYVDTEELYATDYSEDSTSRIMDDVEHELALEEGLVDENTLLDEGVLYDNDLALENLENDFQDDSDGH